MQTLPSKPRQSRSAKAQYTFEVADKMFRVDYETGTLYDRVTGEPTGSLTRRPRINVADTWYLKTERTPYGIKYNHQIINLLTTGEWCEVVNHRDSNGLNNRPSNLEPSTHERNGWDRRVPADHWCGQPGIKRVMYKGRLAAYSPYYRGKGVPYRSKSFPPTEAGLAAAIEQRKAWERQFRK